MALATALVLTIAEPARAQTPVAKIGDPLRISLASGVNVVGPLQSVLPDSVAIGASCDDCSLRMVRRADIVRVEIAHSGGRGVRALVGSFLGAGVGAAVWIIAITQSTKICRDGPCGAAVVFTPAAAGVGAAVGAAVGYLLPVRRWVPATLP